MSVVWIATVKAARKLTVYSKPATRSPVWSTVVSRLLAEFNQLSKRHKLGVQMVASKEAPRDGGGANVAIDLAIGNKIELTFPRANTTETFNSKGLHGRTLQLTEEQTGEMLKAFVYLPAQPEINTPNGVRGVGSNVLTLIALHELLHACGLENSDHKESGLFQPSPSIDAGTKAHDDKGRVQPRDYNRHMPPWALDVDSETTIRGLWAP